MKLTRRELEVVNYIRKEAEVFRKAGSAKYMSEEARHHYLGGADALDRMAGELFEGEHRAYAKGQPNKVERGLGLLRPSKPATT